MKNSFTTSDILQAEYTLEPIKCRYCQSLEVTFNQLSKDSYCASCGQWQTEENTEPTPTETISI